MNDDRAALTALLHKETWLSHGLPPEADCGYCATLADRLIAAGVTLTPSLDEGLLARALHRAYCRDNRPMHSAADHSAAAIAAEYRRLAQEGETP